MERIFTLPCGHFYTEPGRDRLVLVLCWAKMLHADAVWVRPAEEQVVARVPERPAAVVAAEALMAAVEQGRTAPPEA